jgi:hypothetical protein
MNLSGLLTREGVVPEGVSERRDTWQVVWWWRFPWPWCWAFGEWPAHHPKEWRIFRYWYLGLFEVRRLRGTFPEGRMPSE